MSGHSTRTPASYSPRVLYPGPPSPPHPTPPTHPPTHHRHPCSSAGADKWLDVQVFDSTEECLLRAKKLGFQVVVTHLRWGVHAPRQGHILCSGARCCVGETVSMLNGVQPRKGVPAVRA